jgi:peptide/nickel transport system permease protein
MTINVVREPNDGYYSDVWLKKPFCAVSWGARPTPGRDVHAGLQGRCGVERVRWQNERFNEAAAAGQVGTRRDRRAEMYREMCMLMRDDGGTDHPVLQQLRLRRKHLEGHMGDILRLVLKRLGLGLLTLFVVSILIFFAVELLPGDIAQAVLGQSATPETVAALREQMGLNLPAPIRYLDWLGGALTGDFGVSLVSGERVSTAITGRFVNTLFLATYAAVIAVPVSIILGVIVALLRNTLFDRVANVLTLTSISSPEFFLGYILILYFAVKSNYFPAIASLSGDMTFAELLHRTFLPALTLVLVVTAHMMRMTRAAIINLLASPYIEMARLKGVPPWRVIVKHALPNAWAPIINVVALNLAYLITGVVLVEVVFVYPGIGQLLVDAVAKRDFPIVQACCLIFAATFILLNLAADVGAILTNPRLRHPK